MSNMDHSPTHEASYDRAAAHHNSDHQLQMAERELARIDTRQNPTFEQVVEHSRQMLKESYLDAQALDAASHAQRDFLLRALTEVPISDRTAADAQAFAFVRQQEKSLNEMQSNLQLRAVEARLDIEAHICSGSAMRELILDAKFITDYAAHRIHDAVKDINRQMRDLLEEWRANSGHPIPATFSSNTNFAESPEGHVVVYLSPGGKGDIQAWLQDGSSVTVDFSSTRQRDVHWNWQATGLIREDATHPSQGVDEPRFNLNLESTREKNGTDIRVDKTQSNSGSRLEGGAALPVKVAELEAKGSYHTAQEHSGERSQAEMIEDAGRKFKTRSFV